MAAIGREAGWVTRTVIDPCLFLFPPFPRPQLTRSHPGMHHVAAHVCMCARVVYACFPDQGFRVLRGRQRKGALPTSTSTLVRRSGGDMLSHGNHAPCNPKRGTDASLILRVVSTCLPICSVCTICPSARLPVLDLTCITWPFPPSSSSERLPYANLGGSESG